MTISRHYPDVFSDPEIDLLCEQFAEIDAEEVPAYLLSLYKTFTLPAERVQS